MRGGSSEARVGQRPAPLPQPWRGEVARIKKQATHLAEFLLRQTGVTYKRRNIANMSMCGIAWPQGLGGVVIPFSNHPRST